MRICSVDGCDKEHDAKGLCNTHYARMKRTGDPLKLNTAIRGTSVNNQGYRVYAGKLLHILVAEKAIGKKLPKGAIVHHVNEDKTDNRNSNLLICDRAFHKVIHQRLNAMNACGNPNWRKCMICKKYDDPKNLYIPKKGNSAVHNSCRMNKYHLNKENQNV